MEEMTVLKTSAVSNIIQVRGTKNANSRSKPDEI